MEGCSAFAQHPSLLTTATAHWIRLLAMLLLLLAGTLYVGKSQRKKNEHNTQKLWIKKNTMEQTPLIEVIFKKSPV